MGILRLSHVDIKVPDLDLAAAYYSEVMGLDISEMGMEAYPGMMPISTTSSHAS